MDSISLWIASKVAGVFGGWGTFGVVLAAVLAAVNAMSKKDRKELFSILNPKNDVGLFRVFVKGWRRIKDAWGQRKQTGLASEEFWTQLGLIVTGVIYDAWRTVVHLVFVLLPLYYSISHRLRAKKG